MKLLLNILWLLLGGIFTALEYLAASLLMMVTIIGIPFGLQTLKLALVALWPFGKRDTYQTYFRRVPEPGNECDLDLYRWSLDRSFPSGFRLTTLYYYNRNSFWKTTL